MDQDHASHLQAALDEAHAEIARLRDQRKDDRRELEALREARDNLHALFHHGPDAIFICSSADRIIDLNHRAADLFGLPRMELMALSPRLDLLRPRGPLDKFEDIRAKLPDGDVLNFNWVAKRPGDGKLFPVEISLAKTIWDRQDAMLVCLRDITQNRRIKNLLRRRRKLLAVILDGTPIATFVIDTEHRVIFWNKACEILTGVPRSECLGKPVDSRIFYPEPSRPVLADLVLTMDRPKIAALYRDKNLSPSAFIPEAFEASDRLAIQGAARSMYFLAARCRDERGEIVGAIETIQDITERTQAEAELRASKRLLTEITANIPGVVYQYQASGEEQGSFTFISEGIWNLFGLPAESTLRKPELFFERVDPEVRKRFSTSLTCSEPPEHPVEFEFSMRRDEGGIRWFKNSSLASRNRDGTVVWNGMLTDITEIKRVESLRADVERMVRHDLKSPLTGIGGLAKVLLREELPDRQREIVSTIYQSAMKLLHMLGHSMALFKMEEGAYELQPEPFDLIRMLHGLHEEFLPSAIARSLEFVYLLDGNPLPWDDRYMLSGEAILLESLFANLIQNAVDAAPEGTRITIAVRSPKNNGSDRHQGSLRGAMHEIDIHNFGAIPEDIRDHFFDRYVTYGKEHGSGIGTYSAMLIAKTHGGTIRFTTSEAEGTHLVVSLPRRHPA
ncbi:sensor histidine kinase [Desulfonatronum lacustre]|uniref:sensor histidine kinase n=1 Tax=Desulfonatronum lacustre TaxID=66849 RepID=UPI0004AD20F2|nr:PAS domain-containing sensor histidine kinase [Desulfonatronum lacustre]